MGRRLSAIFIFLMSFTSYCLCKDNNYFDLFNAGDIISENTIEEMGLETFFIEMPINEEILTRIKGKSYKSSSIDIGELRYLRVLHKDIEGNVKIGELICNRRISGDLLDIFMKLFNAGYPIERMILVDEYDGDDELSMAANNSSCFNDRTIGKGTRPSNHARGLAIDINPLYNPEIKTRNGKTTIRPDAGKKFKDRTLQYPYMIKKGDLCYREFINHGFRWGGSWRSSKDYQHFEKIL